MSRAGSVVSRARSTSRIRNVSRIRSMSRTPGGNRELTFDRSRVAGRGLVRGPLVAFLLAGLLSGAPLLAQDGHDDRGDRDGFARASVPDTARHTHTLGDPDEPVVIPWAAEVPFGPGERLEYNVKMGAFSVGDAALEVEGVDTVRGFPSYHVSMSLKGGIPLARVDDYFQSWLDAEMLISRRFHQQIREAGYESDRYYEILPEEGRWERTDEPTEGEMPTNFPLDDISFMYFVRTLDLTPGKEYRFDRYFKEDGNPVVVQVVGKDRIEVPAGTFETVVVRPVIQTDGLFSEGGEAELHFTDDEDHYLVFMRVKIPLVRSMTLHLEHIHEGREVLASTPEEEGDPGAGVD